MEIIVADELPVVRMGISGLLAQRGLNTSREAGLFADLDLALADMNPGVLILLGSLPDVDLPGAVQHCVRRQARAAVMLTRVVAADVVALELAGVRQFCMRASSPRDLSLWTDAAIEARPFTAKVLSNLWNDADQTTVTESDADALSDRERAVLVLLIEGKSNREIAAQLFITLATVKSHIQKIYAKLNVANRNEARGRAVALGLVGRSG